MHWRNSNFQIEHFIAGACHTPDEAYRKLRELEEERVMALNNARVQELRLKARQARARAWWRRWVPWIRLQDEADALEVALNLPVTQACIAAAEAELACIRQLIDKVQPLRQYRDRPDPEAHQAAQREEWRLELMHRAENGLAAQGVISPDQLAVMRSHPDFESHILPRIREVRAALEQQKLVLAGHRPPLIPLS